MFPNSWVWLEADFKSRLKWDKVRSSWYSNLYRLPAATSRDVPQLVYFWKLSKWIRKRTDFNDWIQLAKWKRIYIIWNEGKVFIHFLLFLFQSSVCYDNTTSFSFSVLFSFSSSLLLHSLVCSCSFFFWEFLRYPFCFCLFFIIIVHDVCRCLLSPPTESRQDR